MCTTQAPLPRFLNSNLSTSIAQKLASMHSSISGHQSPGKGTVRNSAAVGAGLLVLMQLSYRQPVPWPFHAGSGVVRVQGLEHVLSHIFQDIVWRLALCQPLAVGDTRHLGGDLRGHVPDV